MPLARCFRRRQPNPPHSILCAYLLRWVIGELRGTSAVMVIVLDPKQTGFVGSRAEWRRATWLGTARAATVITERGAQGIDKGHNELATVGTRGCHANSNAGDAVEWVPHLGRLRRAVSRSTLHCRRPFANVIWYVNVRLPAMGTSIAPGGTLWEFVPDSEEMKTQSSWRCSCKYTRARPQPITRSHRRRLLPNSAQSSTACLADGEPAAAAPMPACTGRPS